MRTKSPYQVIELGLPYHMLREVLKQIEDAVETPLQGFGDLSVEAIMQVTGLPHADAILAKQREYDEPYLLQGPQALIEEVCRQIVTRGLRWTKGGRLFHLMGENDKGEAASVLLRCYHRQQRMRRTSGADRNGWDRGQHQRRPSARHGGLPDSRPETRRIL